jgi:F-type H+-transporting ATPase subunit alpha
MLKQPPHSPIPFYKQVVLIYAGINGYLDKLPVEKIREFEEKLYAKLDTVYKDVEDKIKEVKDLTSEIEEGMKKVIEEVIEEI